MKDRNLKGYLQQSLGEEVQPKRLEETIKLCTEIVREQEVTRAEPRTGFFHYLSDVFRFEGIPIFGLQAVTLFIVCLTIASIADVPKNIPIFKALRTLLCAVRILHPITFAKETEFTDMCDCNAGFLHLLGYVSKNIAMVI